MAEEAAPAPDQSQDTPTNESAPESPPEGEGTRADELDPEHLRTQGDVDWEKRYNDLYPEFTRKSQRLSELEEKPASNPHLDELLANPETRQGLLRFLAEQEGYELPDDEEEELEEGDDEFRDPRVDELLAAREEDQRQQLVQEVTGHAEKLIGQHGLELTDRQRTAILRDCWNDGEPDPETTEKVIAGWKADLDKITESAVNKYRSSKKDTPPPPQPGSSGTPDIPITDDRARLQRANEVANQVYSSS